MSGVLWASVMTAAPAIASALVFMLTSRLLQPAEFGLVMLAGSIAMFASAIAPGGFGEALIQREHIKEDHLHTVFWLCVGSSLLIYAVIFANAHLIAGWFGEPALYLLIIAQGTRIVFDLATIAPQSILMRAMEFKKIARRAVIASLLSSAICVTLLLTGYGLWALVVSQISSSILIFAITMLSVRWRPRLRFSPAYFRELASFGLFSSAHRALYIVNVENLLIGFFMGPFATGIFSFAKRIYQIFNEVVTGTFNSVSYPLLSSLQREPEKLKHAFFVSVYASSCLCFPLFAGTAIVSENLILVVLGEQWMPAIPTLIAFCAMGVLTGVNILQSALISSQGRMDWWVYYQMLQKTSTALLIAVLYPYGLTTVVAALTVKLWLSFYFPLKKTSEILNVPIVDICRQLAPAVLSSLAMFLAIEAGRGILAPQSAVHGLLSDVVTGALAYMAALMLISRRRIAELYSLFREKRAG